MTQRRFTLPFAVLLIVLLAPGLSIAQQSAPDADAASLRTAWGDPDLQGVWNHGTATPLQRPEEYAGREFLTEEEIAQANVEATTFAESSRRDELTPERDVALAYDQVWWDRGLSDGRTALIIDPADGRLPPLSPEGEARLGENPSPGGRGGGRGFRARTSNGPEDRNLWERCLTRVLPRLGGAYNNNFQLFQTPTHVAILHEMVHESRIIPLEGSPHLDPSIRQWLGDSRGRWEGDTLVVETTNFTDKTPYQGSTSNVHLVERFSRLDAGTLRYEVTIEDPATWSRPWTAALDLPMTEGVMYEYACHEGNYGMENLLRGARVEEGSIPPGEPTSNR